jgi:hypothetical protein
MKHLIRLTWGALLLAAPVLNSVYAADPVPPRSSGHVLLLDSERVIEGDIDRDGDQYRVRRNVGETRVPSSNVLQLCHNLEEAYDFLRARANLRDGDERMRLARWCHLHNLRQQALAEARAACELRPQSPECRRLRDNLERAAVVMGPPSPAQNPAPADLSSPPPIEVNSDSMGWFATRVQPILMNTCATCHVPAKGGNFRLTRCYEDGMVNRRATQQNLASVLAQINVQHWESSPFLTKAVSVHGEASQPPIKNRDSKAYKALEEWIRTTLVNNPQLRDRPTALAAVSLSQSEPRTEAQPHKAESVFAELAPPPNKAREGTGTSPSPSAGADPKPPVDPFDPAIFNQQQHAPESKTAAVKN